MDLPGEDIDVEFMQLIEPVSFSLGSLYRGIMRTNGPTRGKFFIVLKILLR